MIKNLFFSSIIKIYNYTCYDTPKPLPLSWKKTTLCALHWPSYLRVSLVFVVSILLPLSYFNAIDLV